MCLTDYYTFDGDASVWIRSVERGTFSYSDGEDIENRIHDVVRIARDRSSSSDELFHSISDWPSEYHLSTARSNLLRPFVFEGLRILEIGAGCGALTRYLGESGAHITAVEGSLKRATIAASRCHGLVNVQVCCDDFKQFQCDDKFDAVMLVGVLEYAPGFYGGNKPVLSMLERARSFLKADGVIVVAIENQLGLKYFNGCSEDHTSHLFYGLNDLYKTDTRVITFGRMELIDRLSQAGFSHLRFFFPFPDYKIPCALFSEEGLREPDLNSGQIIGEFVNRDYSNPRRTALFSDSLVWTVVARNRMIPDLSNSFLVFASETGRHPLMQSVDWLVKTFNWNRSACYRTSTTFKRVGSQIKVLKELIHPDMTAPIPAVIKHSITTENDFVHGETLKLSIGRALLDPAATVVDLAQLLKPWADFLRNLQLHRQSASDGILPGTFFDCVPRNLMLSRENGRQILYFDDEWEYLDDLSIEMVLVRGLLHLSELQINSRAIRSTPFKQILLDLMNLLGFPIDERRLRSCLATELKIQNQVNPAPFALSIEELMQHLQHPLKGLHCLEDLLREFRETISARNAQLAERDAELASVMNSLSWRITAFLRWGKRKAKAFLKNRSKVF
jgi:2-polyprenyl-3-methyl-5-hydroxy-6-metoxy-1,4-benzoquinol methylase